MKMSADYACGQILFNLKNSNLHYLIKETHLSAYITIRKKFIKNVEDEEITYSVPEKEINVKKLEDKIKMENGLLKQEINDLKTKSAIDDIEKEEIEMRNKELEKFVLSLENQIEDKYGEIRKFKEILNSLEVKNERIEKDLEAKNLEIADCKEALKKLNVANAVLGDKHKDSEETILMMENVLAKEKQKVSDLETKRLDSLKYVCENCENPVVSKTSLQVHASDLNDENLPSTSKCGTCDYESDDETDFQNHMSSNHINEELQIFEIKCDICDIKEKTEEAMASHNLKVHGLHCEYCGETYIGEKKFRTHTCRKHVPNPDYMDLYMKNWYVRNSCIPVYSKRLKKEIVLLHSEQCWEKKNFCAEITFNLDTNETSVLDENGIIHGPIKKTHIISKDGTICWLGVRGLMLGKMDWYSII